MGGRWWYCRVSVSRANKAINRLRDGAKYITVVWTRGHVGNIGNERADVLAKAGTVKTTVEQIERPLCHLKESIRRVITDEWNADWSNYREGRMSKQFIKHFDAAKTRAALKVGRAKLGTLIRIITGHNALNYFKSKIDAEIDSTCRFCLEEEETFWHFMTDCPVFLNKRREIFGGFDMIGEGWTVGHVLNMAEFCKIHEALMGNDDIYYEDIETDAESSPDPEPD